MKEKFIPGIYNYCDRWCERCTFTSRCKNYEDTGKLSPDQLDINNKAFWDNISSNFKEAIRLLHKAAKEHGIDLNSISQEDEENYKKKEFDFYILIHHSFMSLLVACYKQPFPL